MIGFTEVSFTAQKSEWNIIYLLLESNGRFCMPFFVPSKSYTFFLNIMGYWNDHWNNFVETTVSNTLSMIKLIRSFPFRSERKTNLRQKIFRALFSSLNYVLTSNFSSFELCFNLSRCVVLLEDEILTDQKVEKRDRFAIFARHVLNQ